MRDLRAFAWSMSQLPGMSPGPPPVRSGRRTCVSCGAGTYKGRSQCSKCAQLEAAELRRSARVPAQARARPRAECWICKKLIVSHGAPRPTCSACRAKHGAGICSKCDGPKRTLEPGLCRDCRGRGATADWAAPSTCELCEETYIPKCRPRTGERQRFCSKSCAAAWGNGARPPYTRRQVVGDSATRHKAKSRARHLRRAQTWDGITDTEIFDRDGWRCQVPGCKRRPIRRAAKFPHPRSASIDHIIPLSFGGDDTAVNKRAAHLGCNVARGNKVGAEQLALIGSLREPPLVTQTITGVKVKVRVLKPCACGKPKPARQKRCEDCWQQIEDTYAQRRQAREARLLKVAEQQQAKAALHAEIRKLRYQGLPHRAIAEYLGTSQRMVCRVLNADLITGKLPR